MPAEVIEKEATVRHGAETCAKMGTDQDRLAVLLEILAVRPTEL